MCLQEAAMKEIVKDLKEKPIDVFRITILKYRNLIPYINIDQEVSSCTCHDRYERLQLLEQVGYNFGYKYLLEGCNKGFSRKLLTEHGYGHRIMEKHIYHPLLDKYPPIAFRQQLSF